MGAVPWWKAGDFVSTVQAITYDYPATVTVSDSTKDPAGPFTGLLVTSIAGGTALKVTPKFGPLAASSLSLVVFAGQYIQFPVQRVWSTGTTATVVGLKSPIIQGGQ